MPAAWIETTDVFEAVYLVARGAAIVRATSDETPGKPTRVRFRLVGRRASYDAAAVAGDRTRPLDPVELRSALHEVACRMLILDDAPAAALEGARA
jgi:hypothetical protein